MQLQCSRPEYTSDLARFWHPYSSEGPKHLRGHEAYFSLSVPDPALNGASARLHVAVPFVDIEDLQIGRGLKEREDFDRLMDLVRQVVGDLVECNILEAGKTPVEIIAEPLTLEGGVKSSQVDWVSFAIGATWLTHAGAPIFSGYRQWNPEKAKWEEE